MLYSKINILSASKSLAEIKKKLEALKMERAKVLPHVKQVEEELRDKNEKQKEEIDNFHKKIDQLEGDLGEAQIQIEEAKQNLEKTTKHLANAESVVDALKRRLQDYETGENKLWMWCAL